MGERLRSQHPPTDPPGVLRARAAAEINLVLVAARELARRSLDLPGVRFRLRKGIPISAGLGGGSADGAAALLALDRLWQLHLPSVNLRVMATEIGSDVPFCLSGGSPTLLALARDEEHAGQLAGAVRPAFARVEVARGPVPGVTFG